MIPINNGEPYPLIWSGTGNSQGIWAHYSHSLALGDGNGDGYRDLAVGAPWETFFIGDQAVAGVVYVYNGSAMGLSQTPYRIIHPSDCAAPGATCGFGWSVAMDNVNGDGYDDLAIGAINPGGLKAGRVYVYLGSPRGVQASPTWTGQCDDERYCRLFGWSLALGDVSGDGLADLAVGAPDSRVRVMGIEYAVGKAFFFLGSPSGPSAFPAWSSIGPLVPDDNGYYGFGATLAMGDVDGDGFAELAVAAPDANSTGMILLYIGSPKGLSPVAAWSSTGNGLRDGFFGDALSLGDLNGDGLADLAALEPGVGVVGNLLVFFGSSTGLPGPPDLSFVIQGTWGTGHGTPDAAPLAIGDINGDRISDLLVGAPVQNRTHVLLGSPWGPTRWPVWSLSNSAEGGGFGNALAAADVNGDGKGEVAVGAPNWNSGRFPSEPNDQSGKAYLFLGSQTIWPAGPRPRMI